MKKNKNQKAKKENEPMKAFRYIGCQPKPCYIICLASSNHQVLLTFEV